MFMDVWIASLMDRVRRVCVCVCLCPCSAAPFPFALQPLCRCAAIIGFLATDRCLVPWRVYNDSALAPCLVPLVFMGGAVLLSCCGFGVCCALGF